MSEFLIKLGIENISPSQWLWSIGSGFGILIAWRYLSRVLKKRSIQKLIDLKWRQRKEQIEKLKTKLNTLDQVEIWQEILQKSFEDLLQELQLGSLKVLDVLHAYQWKALESNEKLNNIVWFIDEAEVWAQTLDALPSDQRGPLHGIPLSVKECNFVQNCDSTAGMCQFIHQPCDRDSVAVKIMKKFGAIPFCLTNVPQTMYSMQCSNPPYGTTGNAHNPNKECGGSSGGEGSLIGSGGSILGLGSDVGGSLRNPAFFNGIYSLKPTHGRHLSTLGQRGPYTYEQVGISTVAGFMSSSAKALSFAYKTLYNEGNQNLEDPSIAPLKWQNELFEPGRKLTIGYYDSDGSFEPHPGCKRVVQEAVAILEKQGHTLIKFTPPGAEVQDLYLGLILADGSKNIREALNKDVLIDSALLAIDISYYVMLMPDFVRKLVNFLANFFTKEYLPKPLMDPDEIWAAVNRKEHVSLEYSKQMESLGIDLIITPGGFLPAPDKECLGEMPSCIRPYTPWNILNMPAGIVPISKVTEQDDKDMESLPNNDLFYKFVKQRCKNSVGLPLGIQIVGRRFQEELILSLMTELEEVSNKF